MLGCTDHDPELEQDMDPGPIYLQNLLVLDWCYHYH